MKTGFIVIWAIIAIVALMFILSYAGLVHYKFFAPKIKEAERQVWEQTPSRVFGAIQDIAKGRKEYGATNSTIEQQAICDYLMLSYPELNPEAITDYKLRQFYEMCKYGN